MKRTPTTRIASALLAVIMVFLMIPAGVVTAIADALSAHDAEQGSTVDRTKETVKFIYTPEDLAAIAQDLGGTYVLMNDIDLSEYGNWTPIGAAGAAFTGAFLGAGYTISGMWRYNES